MSFNPDNGKIVKVDSVTSVEKINELAELNLDDIDFQEIERRASIFTKHANYVPVDEKSVRLVSVEDNGKLIYEDYGRMQLADSQQELAESKYVENKRIPMPKFFGKSKAFGNKDDDQYV